MIDFVKGSFGNKSKVENFILRDETLLRKGFFNAREIYSYSQEKFVYPIKAELHNMHINISKQGGYIMNSLHKLNNVLEGRDVGNYNDFSFLELIKTLEWIEKNLNYPLNEISITNLEFGFNLDIDLNPSLVLDNNILMYDFQAPCYNPKNNRDIKIKKFTTTNYEIKVYNKSLQYQLEGELSTILRIEVKYKSRRLLNKLNIYSLEDLRNPNTLSDLYEDFCKKIDRLLIIDNYAGCDSMKKRDKEQIKSYTHPNFWINLKQNAHRNTVLKHKKQCLELIKKYDLNNWEEVLKDLIYEKFKSLMGFKELNIGLIDSVQKQLMY